MKAETKDIQITMTTDDGKKLQAELRKLLETVTNEAQKYGCSPDVFREEYPKLNEFLAVLNVRDERPF
jgi:hypothetical protein